MNINLKLLNTFLAAAEKASFKKQQTKRTVRPRPLLCRLEN